MQIVQQTPTHIITGFLGAGKTSFFNACLATFLVDETWAILVNEIGKIGIDDKLLDKADSLAIKQISGGCICCTSQLPLQIAVATLLRQNQPKRLWIEPTGLAHPAQLVKEFSATHWQSALSLQSIVAIVNAHQWQDERYRNHDGYQAHIVYSDVVVVNRFDKLTSDDKVALRAWVLSLNAKAVIIWQANKYFDTTEMNTLKHALFAKTKKQIIHRSLSLSANHLLSSKEPILEQALEMQVYYHQTQDLHTVLGWQLPSELVCDMWQLSDYLKTLPNWVRIKAVVHGDDGWLSFNFTQDSCDIATVSKEVDSHSRIEVILASDDDISQDTLERWGRDVQGLFVLKS